MPTALGGKGGGVTTDEENVLWIKNRLENFPTLPDLSTPVSTSTGSVSGTMNTPLKITNLTKPKFYSWIFVFV